MATRLTKRLTKAEIRRIIRQLKGLSEIALEQQGEYPSTTLQATAWFNAAIALRASAETMQKVIALM